MMDIYNHYIAPLSTWLHQHPNYALLFTCFISFLESLAIIGTLIPGSLTMTAIGILAGSGVMRFDLTLCVASLGAFIGDGISYVIGFTYSNRLNALWPFNRYPNLLNYGHHFFNRHGGKSVLIGRFIGPLRSIIPLIAGMLNMPRLHFFIANIISGIGWAILYLTPGYIIGAASTQLSSDSARRLFGFVMGMLIAAWILTHILRAIIKNLNHWFTIQIQNIWNWSQTNTYSTYLLNWLTTTSEKNPQNVIQFLIAWLCCLLMTLIITAFVVQDTWISFVNAPISFFLHTLRMPKLDSILITITLILSSLSLSCFGLMVSILTIYHRNWRLLKYWVSLILSTLFIAIRTSALIPINHPNHLFAHPIPATYPILYLCLASALFSFLIFYLMKNYHKTLSLMITYLMLTILVLSGFSALYLGDNWLSSVLGSYGIGLTIGLLHWILYKRKHTRPHAIGVALSLSACLFLITTTIAYQRNFQTIVLQHTPQPKQYTLNQDTWWYQNEPILPVYSTNRIGRRIGVFNIQYAGSIHELEKRLGACGWRKQSKSFLYSLIILAEGRHVTEGLPIMEQLYLNKNPRLTMSYRSLKEDNLYILRLWRSNYHLLHYQEPIWLGNIILARKQSQPNTAFTHLKKIERSQLFVHILPAVHDYQITHIPIQDPTLKSLPYDVPSELLIIKN